MDDPTALVNAKSEPSTSLVTVESATATNLTFSQGQETPNTADVSVISKY